MSGTKASAPGEELERTTLKAVTRRLVPLLMTCFFVAYLDRSNVAYAALQMNADLGFGPRVYGFGAGLFFVGYCLFEVPSNLLLHRFGARRWICRIMITWGLCAALMAAVWSESSFYALRFLFGLAEAGFYPGMLYYVSTWFPARERGRVVGTIMSAVPISGIISGPLSGALLTLDGRLGLQGWQWMFIIEALPAILLAPVVLRVLTDSPRQAEWLSPEQRSWLIARLQEEERANESRAGHAASMRALLNPFVFGLAVVYFAAISLNNSIGLFLPQIVKSTTGLSDLQVGFASVVPSLVGFFVILAWSRHSDRINERKWHAALAMLMGAVGLIAATMVDTLPLRLLAFSIALSGVMAMAPCFWAIPPMFLSGLARAGGIAAISSFGILGGFVAPTIIGALAEQTGSFARGQQIVAVAAALAAALLVLLVGKRLGAPADARPALSRGGQPLRSQPPGEL
jgi:ACS family tartrate transporter-like MFS transporter